MTADPALWIVWGIACFLLVVVGFALLEHHGLARSSDRYEPLTYWLRRVFHAQEHSSAGRIGRVLLLLAAGLLILGVIWLTIHILVVAYI